MAKKKTSVILKAKQIQNLKNSIHIHLPAVLKNRNKRKKARVFRAPQVPPPINRIIHQEIVLPYNHGALRPQGQSNALQSNQAEELRKLYNDIIKDREPIPDRTNSVLFEEMREKQDIMEKQFNDLNPMNAVSEFATPMKEAKAKNMTPRTAETAKQLRAAYPGRKKFPATEEDGQKLLQKAKKND